MTEQERINETLQRQIDAQNARIDTIATKVDIFIAESQQQREDMRRLWERQDAMQAKHDAEMKAMQEKQDAKMHEMNQRFYDKVDTLSQQIQDTWKQTMIGVGGMIIALGALIITALK